MIKRILIVDDSALSRKITRKCLEFAGQGGVEYFQADSGTSALAQLEHGGIDLMVTDINMPGMDGFELLRALAEIPSCKSLITIVSSSAVNAAVTAELKSLGATAVLAKPLTPVALAKTLAETQARRQAQP